MRQIGPVTLRLADVSDRPALERLAQLDSHALPREPHLVAEREGRLDAALSLSSKELIADPFRRTAELCELLRHHAGVIGTDPDHPRARVLGARPILEGA
jgi:hypothetical protein